MKYSIIIPHKCERILLMLLVILFCFSCQEHLSQGRVVLCVPVYGQSLAFGEETQRITNIDSLNKLYDYRILDEQLENHYGYYESDGTKKWLKRMFGVKNRDFEVSIYGMAECLVKELGQDSMICVFAGGQGATPIAGISKGTHPYEKFLSDLKSAKAKADEKGMQFVVPAICWMQGESDMYDYTYVDYKSKLKRFAQDINEDVKRITGQRQNIKIVMYQTNMVALCHKYNPTQYSPYEITIPQAQLDLIREDSMFVAGTPTYLFPFARERMHADAIGQKMMGAYNAKVVLDIIRKQESHGGVYPKKILRKGNVVKVVMNIPTPPLQFDTINVRRVKNYGFDVVTPLGNSIIERVAIQDDTITIACSKSPQDAKVRYAVNGENGKSGRINGARGNLRDSQGDYDKMVAGKKSYPQYHWCYQFDEIVK